MRLALAGPALVGALLATAALGADDGLERSGVKLSGEAELIATYQNLNGGPGVIQPGEASNLWTMGAGGALDAALGSWHLQTDFGGEGNLNSRSSDDTYLGSFGGGVHAGWRDPEIGSLGIFGTGGKFRIHDSGNRDPKTAAWGVGLEGQYFFDPATLYLQTGYIDRQSVASGGDKDALKNAGFLRVIGRYFITDTFKLQAEGSYAQGKMDPDGDDVFIGGWGAEVEYQPFGIRAFGCCLPISGFIKYSGAYYFQNDDSDKLWDNRIGFGVRIYFGQPSLKANDRHGTSLDLPRYLQWQGVVAGPLE